MARSKRAGEDGRDPRNSIARSLFSLMMRGPGDLLDAVFNLWDRACDAQAKTTIAVTMLVWLLTPILAILNSLGLLRLHLDALNEGENSVHGLMDFVYEEKKRHRQVEEGLNRLRREKNGLPRCERKA